LKETYLKNTSEHVLILKKELIRTRELGSSQAKKLLKQLRAKESSRRQVQGKLEGLMNINREFERNLSLVSQDLNNSQKQINLLKRALLRKKNNEESALQGQLRRELLESKNQCKVIYTQKEGLELENSRLREELQKKSAENSLEPPTTHVETNYITFKNKRDKVKEQLLKGMAKTVKLLNSKLKEREKRLCVAEKESVSLKTESLKYKKLMFGLIKKYSAVEKERNAAQRELESPHASAEQQEILKQKILKLGKHLKAGKQERSTLKSKFVVRSLEVNELKKLLKKLNQERNILSKTNQRMVSHLLSLKKEIDVLKKNLAEKESHIEGRDLYYKSFIDSKVKPQIKKLNEESMGHAQKEAELTLKIEYMKQVIGELMKKEVDLKAEMEILKKRKKKI